MQVAFRLNWTTSAPKLMQIVRSIDKKDERPTRAADG